MSNERVADIVNSYYRINDPAGAADKIIDESVKCWKRVKY
jgi:hypothetical protein